MAIPASFKDKLYVKAESIKRASNPGCQDRLEVDAMAITYQTSIGPFAQGDTVVSFVNLLNDATVPIVLYRPASSTTDLGLYGSSHVGVLGGIIGRTNIPAILQLDLLKTDFFHANAYPTYLYYNPCPTSKSVTIDVGQEPVDLYDATSDQVVQKNVKGKTEFTLAADGARILVLAPAGGTMTREKGQTLIDDVIVRYAN
jgi:hypothetical protein